ncbi:hypothetical protein GCM10025857_17020 [Alicyclobacillus contaminans]|uniref:hypothetical protein n=1 Tax=Alicyclobacillus contaminans TaxID=392016 RepID=UPI00041187AD|nr:hypothetical protein [Alicyclobacillus contaminans]GMA50345.1 hypothetical protein GCM10025857_17020 [Alicyclobacillus contaminans]
MNFSFVGPAAAPFIILPILMPIAALVLAIYVVVCIQQIKKSTQEAALELKEIRRLLSEYTRQG